MGKEKECMVMHTNSFETMSRNIIMPYYILLYLFLVFTIDQKLVVAIEAASTSKHKEEEWSLMYSEDFSNSKNIDR